VNNHASPRTQLPAPIAHPVTPSGRSAYALTPPGMWKAMWMKRCVNAFHAEYRPLVTTSDCRRFENQPVSGAASGG